MHNIEIGIDGIVHRCYRARPPNGHGMIERWIVAGVGSVTIARDSGAILDFAAVIADGGTLLARIAPIIHQRAPLPSAA